MADTPPTPRIPPAAWLVLLLGLASVPVFPVAAPALIIGLRTLRAIHAADGALRGVRVVIAGLALAVVGASIPVVGVVAMLLLQVQATSRRVECADHLRQIGIALNKY